MHITNTAENDKVDVNIATIPKLCQNHLATIPQNHFTGAFTGGRMCDIYGGLVPNKTAARSAFPTPFKLPEVEVETGEIRFIFSSLISENFGGWGMIKQGGVGIGVELSNLSRKVPKQSGFWRIH